MTCASWRSELASLGPYFALEVIDGRGWEGRLETLSGGVDDAPWQPLSVLIDDPQALDARVRAVARALTPESPGNADGSGERDRPDAAPARVAASVAHLGIVARLISPWLGARALGHPWPPLRTVELWWRDILGGPLPLAIDTTHEDPDHVDAHPDPPHTRRRGEPVDAENPLIGSAVEAITVLAIERYGLGSHVGWGNVASAANGAAMMLARQRADLAAAAQRAADAVLADRRVEGGILRSGEGFRRRSCCLIYRLTGGPVSVCGDCVLGAPAAR